MMIILSGLLVVAILLLFLPLLRNKAEPDFYRSGSPDEDRRREAEKVKSLLGDLRQEFDSGKLGEEEFASLAGSLMHSLERLEKSRVAPAASGRLQLCPACGARSEESVGICAQCGSPLGGNS